MPQDRPGPSGAANQRELFCSRRRKRRKPQRPVRPLSDRVCELALPVPLPKTYHYRIPEEELGRVQPGARVRAPFGRRRLVGICLAVGPLADCPLPPERLRAIDCAMDEEPALGADLLQLCRFVASYYRAPLGEALAAALPAGVRRRRRLPPGAAAQPQPTHPERARGAAAIGSKHVLSEAEACPERSRGGGLQLTGEQAAALRVIRSDLDVPRFGVTLVHGVTGSGKTEVYLRACQAAISKGRTALCLVPEIALTPQTVRRFEARFGKVALLHSLLGPAERARSWARARRGEVRVAIGPRSAVFAPLPDLGIIVVDEEHEPTFKQQESAPRYSARDLAIVRAKALGAACVLGSATPSLESLQNARAGRYKRVRLTTRPTGAPLPAVEVVDLREESKAHKGFPFLSRRLLQAMRQALGGGEQVILFLNRLGFATFLRCTACGHVLGCGECDVALTYHKQRKKAVCHGCDVVQAPPTLCPSCGQGPVRYLGFGTERIEEQVALRFPDAVCRRLDSEVLRGGQPLDAVLEDMREGRAQVLIGTQMVAKGLDFPGVRVVGVISADTGLNLPDFRAAERTFQLCAQVAGRAGRGNKPGVTIIQTFAPEHPAIRYATRHDSDGFAASELVARERLGYPPFGRLARVVVSARQKARARAHADRVFFELRAAQLAHPVAEPARILGPAPCPIAKLRSRYRFLLLVKAPTRAVLAPLLDAVCALSRPPGDLRVALDVDPQSML